MAFQNLKSFHEAQALSFLVNIAARNDLLNKLDMRMAANRNTKRAAKTSCPEHLFSTDENKLAIAALQNA